MSRPVRPAAVAPLALVALLTLLLAACGGAPDPAPSTSGPVPLTTEQAQRLATVRFNNFNEGVRGVAITTAGRDSVAIDGWMDFASHLGYGLATSASLGAPSLISWHPGTVEFHDLPDRTATAAPLPVPDQGWKSGALDSAATTLSNVLAITLQLAADRAENPQLLQQSDARFLGSDTIDGTAVEVMSGPSPASGSGSTGGAAPSAAATRSGGDMAQLRYWVDERGLLLRLQIPDPSSAGSWSVVDLSSAPGVVLGIKGAP